MKKLLIAVILTAPFITVRSQQQDTQAFLKSIDQVPAFSIVTVPDSTAFTNGQIKKDRPLAIIFFNPDCEHCQKETKELVAYKEELKDIQIIMISALPYQMIRTFYYEYNVFSMPNVTMGQDPAFKLGTKYRPNRYPAIFIYDNTGKLAKVFAGNAGAPAIIQAALPQ